MADEYIAYEVSNTWRSGVTVRRDTDGVLGIKWTDRTTGEEWFEWYEDTEGET